MVLVGFCTNFDETIQSITRYKLMYQILIILTERKISKLWMDGHYSLQICLDYGSFILERRYINRGQHSFSQQVRSYWPNLQRFIPRDISQVFLFSGIAVFRGLDAHTLYNLPYRISISWSGLVVKGYSKIVSQLFLSRYQLTVCWLVTQLWHTQGLLYTWCNT